MKPRFDCPLSSSSKVMPLPGAYVHAGCTSACTLAGDNRRTPSTLPSPSSRRPILARPFAEMRSPPCGENSAPLVPARQCVRSQSPLLAGFTEHSGLRPWLSSRTGVPSASYSTTARAAVASLHMSQLKQASMPSGRNTSASISLSKRSPVAFSITDATSGKLRLA